MAHRIVSVDPGSPAEKAGVRVDDRLVGIDGKTVVDFLDYQEFSAERRLTLNLRRGEQKIDLKVKKGEYESLGLNFQLPMMSPVRMCLNHCLFCFVDQLPAHVRDTMRVKDDDWRMSLMMGNYVTLTNITERELDRIIARHASPLYVSVHAMDPDLREKLLQTPRARMLADQLQKLSDNGIEFHCQAVLCPGLNDGDALEDTIRRLTALPGALSLALVPVGLTDHREGLYPLRKYNRDEARRVIEQANVWRKRLLAERGTRFVFPSDEFYLQAGMEVPADDEYEDYGQIDDGVGLLRKTETEFAEAWDALPAAMKTRAPGRKIAIACGVSAGAFLKKLTEEHPIAGAEIEVIPVENRFFGPSVTVSGLVTGGDLIRRLAGVECECVLITECMLRNEGDKFLDDRPIEEVSAALGKPIYPVGRRGDELLDAILDRIEGTGR